MENIEKIRHSLSHILASVILEMYPKTKLGIGPAIENGFYYDFQLAKPLAPEDLAKIEARMKELIKEKQKFVKKNITKRIAKRLFAVQPYKLELIKDLPGQTVSIYTTGAFVDLCKGPHIKSTKEIDVKAFKLAKIAGAYWKGSEKNKMLTRIYGLAFETEKELTDYLKMMEEAEKRDHRKLGKELDLFSFHDEAPGFPFWHPKGMILRSSLMELHDKIHKAYDYKLVSTPILLSEELWHRSGHWDHYKDNMYFTKIDNKTFAIKPMNCPGVILIYKERPRSYKDLPLRFAENGEVHRHEPSGTLHGLFRVRAFRQDDAHIFAKEDQIEQEIKNVVKMVLEFYKPFNFNDVEIELSTRPEKSMGSKQTWEKSEGSLKRVLKDLNLNFKINKGDGAFYGPKIDFHIKDSIGRSWQCGTIQLDFLMPERFDLEYIDNQGQRKRPVMIHRTVLGSIQRFFGILIEHYAGAFPVWLSPVQVAIIPISEKHLEYAKKIEKQLKENNIRIEIKEENETLGKKIREAEMQKIPYLLIVGDKEVSANAVSVRERGKGDLGQVLLEKFILEIKEKIKKYE